jgi:hypothetical protein
MTDATNDATAAGIIVVGFVVLVGIVLWRSRGSSTPRTLARLGLLCGLVGWPAIAILFLGSSWSKADNRFAAGLVCAVAAGTGILLSGLALYRRDSSVRWWTPTLAVLLCAGQIVIARSMIRSATVVWSTNPWTYRSPSDAFRLTLPSEWVAVPSDENRFHRPFPPMHVRIGKIESTPTEGDYEATVARFEAALTRDELLNGATQSSDGVNASGNRYHYTIARGTSDDGQPVFVAKSLTWLKRNGTSVPITFEGVQAEARSKLTTIYIAEMVEKSARGICLSVE